MKNCAKCGKSVYPLEELKCLDKMWHKTCFKCQECQMQLSMRNYKGFDKLPYCAAHCPTAKYTAVADTPEIRRLAENTKIQSSVKYHEDYEKQKGKVTQVADDPETMRIRQNTRIISNVSYHGELEKKAKMEMMRPLSDEVRPEDDEVVANMIQAAQALEIKSKQNEAMRRPPNKVADYNPVSVQNVPKSFPGTQSTIVYSSDRGQVEAQPHRRVGSIADYDPLNDRYGSLASGFVRPSPVGYQQASPQPAQYAPKPVPVSTGLKFRAMYDYAAADSDEVSFQDGDVIINCQPIDEGWMLGTVQRTGQKGMLPANYVERVM